MSSNRVIIMRGVPGSGKTHEALNIALKALELGQSVQVCSTDRFFIKDDGCYQYDASRLGDYAQQCYFRFCGAVQLCVNTIIVDNTNVKKDSFRRYVDFAKRHYYTVEFREPTSWWWLNYRPIIGNPDGLDGYLDRLYDLAEHCYAHGQHNVSLEKIVDMLCRWYNIPEA